MGFGPLDQGKFEAPGGETWAFRHLLIPTFDRLPTPALIGPSVLAFVEDENVVRGGVGPWYYCDGTRWIPISGSGIGPFWYDAFVDWHWAAEVAAGRGVEGQVMPTFHGFTFRMFSTVQAAVDYVVQDIMYPVAGGIFSGGQGKSASILVAPGRFPDHYAESVDYRGGRADEALVGWGETLHVTGSGMEMTLIGSNVTLPHTMPGLHPGTLEFHDAELQSSGALWAKAATGGNSIGLKATRVRFSSAMAGPVNGARFEDCEFPQGWFPQSGESGSVDNVQIMGGVIAGVFNFEQNDIDIDNWHVEGTRLGPSANFQMQQVTGSWFDVWRSSGVAALMFQFAGACITTTIMGSLGPGSLGFSVIRFDSGTDANRGTKIHIAVLGPSAANASTHFVEVAPGTTLHSTHIDISQAFNGLGRYLEDPVHGTGAVSVIGRFIDCKFTLTPASIMKVLTLAGSADNILDSGVIESGSVGIGAYIDEWLSEIDLGSAIDGAPIVA